MTFVYFDIFHRMTSLRKLFSDNAYFSKVQDLNRALPILANAHTGLTSANTAVLRVYSSLIRHKLIHNSKRSFQCYECAY